MSQGLAEGGRAVPAPLGRRSLEVLSRETVGPYVAITVADPSGPPPSPGQFYMLATDGRWGGGPDERPFLPRAISVMESGDGQIRFLLDDVGPGTRELCGASEGDRLLALGPLGRGFRPAPAQSHIICAGGIGVAPMVALAAALADVSPSVLLGFRDAAHARAAALLAGAQVATDDGSVGREGNAVDLLVDALNDHGQAVVFACGPPGMLAAVRNVCTERGVAAQLALESGMACGYGACFGCVVPAAAGGFVRLCVDGPVLEASDLAEGWEAAYG